MAFDGLLLLTNLATGGVVGYLTNSLAIKMLFKEYPIIGGGEVVKNRDELENAMSELVEERLITPETLLHEFDTEHFKRSFEQLIRYIIKNNLKEQLTRFDIVGDLGGYEQTLGNLKQFLKQEREVILQAVLSTLFTHVQVQNLLSPEQQQSMIERLWQLLLNTLDTHSQELGEALRQSLRSLSGADLLTEDLLTPLLRHVLEGLDQELLNSGLLELADELVKRLRVTELLQQLEERLREMTLSEILGEASTRDTAREIALRLLEFLNTPRGLRLFEELLKNGFQQLEKLDLPLSILLNETLERRILEIMERYLPQVLVLLEEWAAQNRDELEELVHSAIQEHLRSESVVKHMTATLFTDQISARYRIVDNVLQEISSIANQSMPELSSMLTRFLENTSIGSVMAYADQHFLDPTALAKTLLRLFNTYLPRLDLTMLDPIFFRPLGSFSILDQIHLPDLWRRILYPYIRSQLESRVASRLPHWLQTLAQKLWQGIQDRPLSQYLPRQDFEGFIRQLLQLIQESPFEDFILEQLRQSLPDVLQDRSIEEVLTPRVRETLWTKLGHLYDSRLDGFLDSFQQENVDNLYSKLIDVFFSLAENEQVAAEIREVLVNFMIEMIRDNELFKGRIEITVKESFARFSDAEMEREMESFMGNELRPITLLGAVLGASVGGLLSLAAMLPGAQTLVTGLPALAVMPLSYGLTGVGTNWLAIRMLFRPYYARRWPFSQKHLPFTPGVFIKNKAALADSMSRFIDQKLLSKQNMVDILERYHHRWKEVIKSVISHNNYALWDQRFREAASKNYDLLTPLLLDLGFQQLYRNRHDIAYSLIEEAREIQLAPQDIRNIQSDLREAFAQSEPYLQRYFNRRLEDWLQHNYPLNDQLSPPQLQWLHSKLESTLGWGIAALNSLIQDKERSRGLLESLSQRWEQYLDLQLEQLTPGESLPKQEIISYVLEWVQSEALQQEIRQLLERYVGFLLSAEQTLGEMWNGKIIQIIQQESDTLIDIASGYLMEMARQNKGRLSKAVVSDVERQGMLEIMLVNFGGVRKDVSRVVDVVVEAKLESFLESKTEGIKNWWHEIASTQLPQLSPGDLGIDKELFEIESLQHILRHNVLASPRTFTLFNDLADAVLDELLVQLDLKSLLQSVQLYSLGDLLNRFEGELELTRQHLARRLEQEHPQLQRQGFNFALSLLNAQLMDRSPREWLEGISSARLKQVAGRVLHLAYRAPMMNALIQRLLQESLRPLARGDISYFLDYALLERDSMRTIEQLTLASTPRSQAFQATIRDNLKDFTFQFVDVLNINLEQDTKEELENVAVDSLIDGLRINNREVLEPIDFEAIVRREVLKMNPERIESLFDFAQPVFRALIWYGALGGVIGVVAGLLAALG